MQTLNIISAPSNPNSAAKSVKSNPVVNAENSFNKLLKKEINGNKATSASAPQDTNGKIPAKNSEPQKQDPATPPEELNGVTTGSKKTEDTEKDDNQTEKKDVNDSDQQLIQLFNALNDISRSAPPKSVGDVTIKSDKSAGIDATSSGLSLPPLTEKNALPTTEASKEAAFDVIVSNALSAHNETGTANIATLTPVTTDTSSPVKSKETIADAPLSFADQLNVKSEKSDPVKLQAGVQQDAAQKTSLSAEKLERSVDKLAFVMPKDEPVSPVSVQQATPQQQLNATQNATITGVVSANQISPPLNTSAWDKAVGQKVIWMVGASMQSAELTLNPPDLGPLQIVLNVTNDQANATFISAHPDVRDALEASLPKLRQMMDDAGVQLSGFSVNAEASHQGQQSREFGHANRATSTVSNNTNDNHIGNQPISDAKASKIISRIGAVDTFA